MSISACTILEPYQPTLGQGNFVRQEQVAQIELGYSQKQVMLLLGTPMLSGENRENRWVYTTFDEQTGYEKLIISFENSLVSSIERP